MSKKFDAAHRVAYIHRMDAKERRLQHVAERMDALRTERDQLIRTLASNGHSLAHVARLARITRGRAWQIKNECQSE